MNQEYIEKKQKNVALSSDCAYIDLIINENGGRWFLDDRCGGWMWHGDYDNFLLGLLRVGKSFIIDDFVNQALKEEEITKYDIFNAIQKSLLKNPADGIYAVMGDNRFFLSDEIYIYEDNVGEYYKDELVQEGLPRDQADEIVDEIMDDVELNEKDFIKPVEEDPNILYRETEEFPKGIPKNMNWRDFVIDVSYGCMQDSEDAGDMIMCITDKLYPSNDEAFMYNRFEFIDDIIYEKFLDAEEELLENPDKIEELAEKVNIPPEKLKEILETM